MSQKLRKIVNDFILILLFSMTLSGFTIQAFILKTNIGFYLLATGLASFFFALALKNLKYGLFYLFLASVLSAIISWSIIILPPLTIEEEFMVSYTTEIFTQFISRYLIICLPIMVMGLIIGSIAVDGV